MSRKGYASEYRAKNELKEQYGAQNVLKIAIGGAQDFLCVNRGRLVKVVEIKEFHPRGKRKRYYPNEKDRNQFNRIINFCAKHDCPHEVWIYMVRHGAKAEKLVRRWNGLTLY